MNCLDRFNKKMALSGGSLRDEHITNSRIHLGESFMDDPSFQKGIYIWNLGIESYEAEQPIKIQFYKRSYSSANGNSMKFHTQHNTPVVIGDILYDAIYDSYWLCTESYNINDIQYNGKIYECNWLLKWQDRTGRVFAYPCQDQNSTQYNSGETPNKQFKIGSAQHMITLPADENTVELTTPQRFFLDKKTANPTTYILTQNDTSTYNFGRKGLVKLTLTECANNPNTDRPDLGICDYIDPETLKNDNDTQAGIARSVISYSSKSIRSGGSAQTYTGLFYDDSGNQLSDIIPRWTIISDFQEHLQMEEIGNQIIISIDNDNYIDEDFKLILSDTFGHYQSSLIIRIKSIYG